MLSGGSSAAAAPQKADAPVGTWRGPMENRNQFPLALLFVSMTPEAAESLAAGETFVGLQFDYSNVILDRELEDERIRLDLEYLRTAISLSRGIPGGMEVRATLPFYVYYGGFLDPFVSGFHEALGLPNFLRGQTDNGLVEFLYARNGSTIFQGRDSFGAVGDLSFHFKKTLVDRNGLGLGARTELKLPTGDPETLSGSGKADLGLGLAFDRVGRRFGLYANANYHILGKPEKIPARNYFSFMVGFDWHFKPRLAAIFQLDHARPRLTGKLSILNEGSQQLALGVRFRYSERFVYEWRFVEDLSRFSPDFTFGFQMGVRLGSPMVQGSAASTRAAASNGSNSSWWPTKSKPLPFPVTGRSTTFTRGR